MIEKVIIMGIKRGGKYVSPLEVSQMAGRAGRSYTKSGEAILVVPSCDSMKAEECLYGKPPPIESCFGEDESLLFHVLPLVEEGCVRDKDTFDRWFRRSLSWRQGRVADWNRVLEGLETLEAVRMEDGEACVTDLGRISAEMYVSPFFVFSMKKHLAQTETFDSLSLSCILAGRAFASVSDWNEQYNDYCSRASGAFGLEDAETPEGYCIYCLLECLRDAEFDGMKGRVKRDLGRMVEVLERVCSVVGRQPPSGLDECLLEKIPYSLNEYRKMFPGASRILLEELKSLHVTGVTDLDFDGLERIASEGLVRYLKKMKKDGHLQKNHIGQFNG